MKNKSDVSKEQGNITKKMKAYSPLKKSSKKKDSRQYKPMSDHDKLMELQDALHDPITNHEGI